MTVRYCEQLMNPTTWPKMHAAKCKPGESPDVPSFTRCERCGGRVVRATYTQAPR